MFVITVRDEIVVSDIRSTDFFPQGFVYSEFILIIQQYGLLFAAR